MGGLDSVLKAEQDEREHVYTAETIVRGTLQADFADGVAELQEGADEGWSSRQPSPATACVVKNMASSLHYDTTAELEDGFPGPLHKMQEQEASERSNIAAVEESVGKTLRDDFLEPRPPVPPPDELTDLGKVVVSDKEYKLTPFDGTDVDVDLAKMKSAEKYLLGVLAVHVLLPTAKESPELLGGLLEALDLPHGVHEGLVQLCDTDEVGLPTSQVQGVAESLPPAMRLGCIAALMASGIKKGGYDARLRWAMRRLACILKVPWSRVATAELLIANTLLEKVNKSEHVSKGTDSNYRWLKIGAGVVVGAGVLIVTGGLAAPIVAGAATGLLSTTAGIVAATGLTAVATAISATAVSLGAVMTVPVITAMFGVAGAGVTGLKMYKRTAGVGEFLCKSVRDITLPPWLGSSRCDLLSYRHGPGTCVPLSARPVTSGNILDHLSTDRKLVISVEQRIAWLGQMYLAGSHLEAGDWIYEPPKTLDPGKCAIFACQRKQFGVRIEGCAVYSDGKFELCCAFENPRVGSIRHRVMFGEVGTFSRDIENAGKACLQRSLEWTELQREGKKYVASVTGEEEAVFSLGDGEFMQRENTLCTETSVETVMKTMKEKLKVHHNYLVVRVDNVTNSTLKYKGCWFDSGQCDPNYLFPQHIPSGFIGLGGVHNKRFRPTGVSGIVVYESEDLCLCCAFSNPTTGSNKTNAMLGTPGAFGPSTLQKALSELSSEKRAAAVKKDALQYRVVHANDGQYEQRYLLREVAKTSVQTTLSEVNGLHVVIGMSGMALHDDPRVPSSNLQEALWLMNLGGDLSEIGLPGADPYFIKWEPELQRKFGDFMTEPTDYTGMAKAAANKGATEAMKNPAVTAAAGMAGSTWLAFAAVMSSLSWPLYAVHASDIIDSTYGMLVKRAKEAGGLLADMLLQRAQGHRPVTLIGVSLGGNAVFHALLKLAESEHGKGIVESAFIIGSTAHCDSAQWCTARSVVAGRFINVYAGNDWFLSFLHRSNTATLRSVAGLNKVQKVPGLENIGMGHIIKCSSDYVRRLPEVLLAIPAWPTAQTLSDSIVEPGLFVPVIEAEDELAIVAEHLGSNCLGVAVRNKTPLEFQVTCDDLAQGTWMVTIPDGPLCPGQSAIMGLKGGGGVLSSTTARLVCTNSAVTMVIAIRLPAYGDTEAAVHLLPANQPIPSIKELKMKTEEGKHLFENWVAKLSLVGNRLMVTIRSKEADEDDDDTILLAAPKFLGVDAGAVVDIHKAYPTLERLLHESSGVKTAGIAVRNKTSKLMVFCWEDLRSGTWRFVPTPEVPPMKAGCCACSTRLKGLSGIMCFALEDRFSVLIAFSIPLIGRPAVYADYIPIEQSGRSECERLLSEASYQGSRSHHNVSVGGVTTTYKITAKVVPGDGNRLSVSVKELVTSDKPRKSPPPRRSSTSHAPNCAAKNITKAALMAI